MDDFDPPKPPVPLTEISASSTLREIVQEDVAISNAVLKSLYHTWPQAKSVRHVCELAKTTMEVVARRRELLLKPATLTELQRIQAPSKDELTFEIL